ncbi:MAG TPA: hypothetical protein VFU31_10760 [Candidatus Binatia bacterium]|nr:hypothetical protein [Candidatus Binatia bacterium]
MKLLIHGFVTLLVLSVALGGEVGAGREKSSVRSGRSTPAAVSSSAAFRSARAQVYVFPSYPHAYFYYPYGYFYPPGINLLPPYHPYYVPPPVVVNAPFFCLLHQVGFISRIAMLDHLAGTHKFALHTAAAICPDGADGCLFPSY